MTHEKLVELVKAQLFGLKWTDEDCGDYYSITPLGDYRVTKWSDGSFSWSYCFNEFSDYGEFNCEDAGVGKAAAQADYNKRMNADDQTRTAIKIIGEALLIEQKNYHSPITGPTVAGHRILSLTQGTKE